MAAGPGVHHQALRRELDPARQHVDAGHHGRGHRQREEEELVGGGQERVGEDVEADVPAEERVADSERNPVEEPDRLRPPPGGRGRDHEGEHQRAGQQHPPVERLDHRPRRELGNLRRLVALVEEREVTPAPPGRQEQVPVEEDEDDHSGRQAEEHLDLQDRAEDVRVPDLVEPEPVGVEPDPLPGEREEDEHQREQHQHRSASHRALLGGWGAVGSPVGAAWRGRSAAGWAPREVGARVGARAPPECAGVVDAMDLDEGRTKDVRERRRGGESVEVRESCRAGRRGRGWPEGSARAGAREHGPRDARHPRPRRGARRAPARRSRRAAGARVGRAEERAALGRKEEHRTYLSAGPPTEDDGMRAHRPRH